MKDRSAREADSAEQRNSSMPADPAAEIQISCAARPAGGDGRSAAGRGPAAGDPAPAEENSACRQNGRMLLAELGLPDNALRIRPSGFLLQ